MGADVISKYIKSNLGIIKLLQKRNKYNLKLFHSLYFTIIYFLKIVLYIIFYLVGEVDSIIKNRFILLNKYDKESAKEIMFKSLCN
jgi:hypothetical protein